MCLAFILAVCKVAQNFIKFEILNDCVCYHQTMQKSLKALFINIIIWFTKNTCFIWHRKQDNFPHRYNQIYINIRISWRHMKPGQMQDLRHDVKRGTPPYPHRWYVKSGGWRGVGYTMRESEMFFYSCHQLLSYSAYEWKFLYLFFFFFQASVRFFFSCSVHLNLIFKHDAVLFSQWVEKQLCPSY